LTAGHKQPKGLHIHNEGYHEQIMEVCNTPAPKMKRILENGQASSTQKMPQMLVPAQLNQYEHENSDELDCLLADSSYELFQS
jgi:hypothetical protein